VEILVYTEKFDLLGVANRLVDEGHKVTVFTPGKLPEGFGKFERATHPHNAIKACKFIVSDGISNSSVYDWAKQYNRPIIGCSQMTDLMNADCYKEFTIGQRIGAPLPETEVIDDISTMYSKVLDWNPSRTLVRYDRETITCDHQEWLAWAMTQLPLNKKILLQTPAYGEFVTITGWFDGLKWARPFAFKSEGEDRLGASLLIPLKDSALIDNTIGPWGEFLKAVDYHGPFSVRCMANAIDLTVISTYAGFEFPSTFAYIEGLMEPFGEFLNKIALSVTETSRFSKDFCTAMTVRSSMKEPVGVPILGLDEGNQKHIFFGGVVFRESEKVIGPGPWVYSASAHGRDPEESFGRMAFTSKMIKIPEPQFTTGMSSIYKPWLAKLNSLELI
jgi:hypothetical protein